MHLLCICTSNHWADKNFAKTDHHTPEKAKALEEGFSALEIASPDGKNAAIAAFTLADPKTDSFTVIPRGINTNFDYEVTLDNSGTVFTVSSYELASKGISIRIPSSLSSELILIKAITQ